MRKMMTAAIAATALISTAAFAAVTFDAETGTGFVGKGDVQLALGLNNAQVQAIEPVFTYAAVIVTEVSWTCLNTNNQQTQERERTTTSSVTGLVSSTARTRNQVTGYNLSGFDTATTTSTSSTEGPPLNSCPNPNSTNVLEPAGEPTVVSSTGGLFVDGVAL